MPGLIVALAIALAGCGAAQDGLTPETSPAASPSTRNDGNIPDSLQFTAELVGGGTFSDAWTAGQPVVLWFWAPT